MTKYEWYDQGWGKIGMEHGEVSPSKFNEFIMYKVFLDLSEQGLNQAECISQMEERFNCSYSACWRAINSFREQE